MPAARAKARGSEGTRKLRGLHERSLIKNINTNLKSHRILNTVNPFNWFGVLKRIKEIKPDLIISTYWTGLLSPSYSLINKFVSNKS